MAQAKGGAAQNNPVSEIALAIFVILLILILLRYYPLSHLNWTAEVAKQTNLFIPLFRSLNDLYKSPSLILR